MKRGIIVWIIIVFLSPLHSSGQIGYNVDILPSNIGGKAEFKRFFKQELRYPETSLAKKEGGKVVIDFVIHADSTVSGYKIKESVSPAIDAEALRLFKLLQWSPALKNNHAVACNWSTTFSFEPDKYAKICKERGYESFQYIAARDTSGNIEKKPQQPAVYINGVFELKDFIKTNLEYPRQAQLSNLQGVVVLRFVVEPSGLITNIGVKKSIGGGCDEEAIRVLKLIQWYPAKKNNLLVRVQQSYPFYFVLNEDFKDNMIGVQK